MEREAVFDNYTLPSNTLFIFFLEINTALKVNYSEQKEWL